MPIKVGETEIPEPSGPGWYDRILELILLSGTGYFIWWVVNIFIETGMEPVATIGLVGAIVAGTEGILYLNRRKKDDIIRETINYERGFESRPSTAELSKAKDDQAQIHAIKDSEDTERADDDRDDSIL